MLVVCEQPPRGGERPVVDHLAHERLAEAAAAELGEHVDVRQVRRTRRRRSPPGRSRPGAPRGRGRRPWSPHARGAPGRRTAGRPPSSSRRRDSGAPRARSIRSLSSSSSNPSPRSRRVTRTRSAGETLRAPRTDEVTTARASRRARSESPASCASASGVGQQLLDSAEPLRREPQRADAVRRTDRAACPGREAGELAGRRRTRRSSSRAAGSPRARAASAGTTGRAGRGPGGRSKAGRRRARRETA